MLTEQETADMHRFVTELEDRCRPADVITLGRLAAATGDEWEQLVRECLDQWLNPLGLEISATSIRNNSDGSIP